MLLSPWFRPCILSVRTKLRTKSSTHQLQTMKEPITGLHVTLQRGAQRVAYDTRSGHRTVNARPSTISRHVYSSTGARDQQIVCVLLQKPPDGHVILIVLSHEGYKSQSARTIVLNKMSSRCVSPTSLLPPWGYLFYSTDGRRHSQMDINRCYWETLLMARSVAVNRVRLLSMQ